MWFSGVFYNEFFFAVPGPLWFTVRQSAAQRVLDLLRTLPLISSVLVHYLQQSVPLYAWVGVGAWTVVANLAQYRLDAHNAPSFSELTFVLTHVSVVHWLSFSLATSAFLRAAGICVSLAAAGYLLAILLVAVPITQAWQCYPSRDPETFTNGYCPQYTGQFHHNPACKYTLGENDQYYNPRCDPTEWGKYVSVHDIVDHAGHVAFHMLAGTLAFHISMIPAASEKARVQACIAVARHGWKTD